MPCRGKGREEGRQQRLSHKLSIPRARRGLWTRQSKLTPSPSFSGHLVPPPRAATATLASYNPSKHVTSHPRVNLQPGWQWDGSVPVPVTYLCPGDSRGGHAGGIATQGDGCSLGGGDEDRAKLNAGRNWEGREAPHPAWPGPCPPKRVVLCCLRSAEGTRPCSPQSRDAWHPAAHHG